MGFESLVMVTYFCLGVIIVAVIPVIVANEDINVDCLKDSVNVTWKIRPDLVPYAARFFLGSCVPSHLTVLSTGEGEAVFNYKLHDCKFRKLMKGKRFIYQNDLTYRPQAKSKPAAFTYHIECVHKRSVGWVPPFLIPGSTVVEGHGRLVFHMELLNAELSGVATTNVIPLGSFIPIWAAVEQKSHQPLLLFLEECVAATTPELQPDSQVYPIITNKGCLLDGKRGKSRFLPRYHSSAIVLYLQTFKFGLGEEVYIHCKLAAWDPDVLNESKKACHYVKESGRFDSQMLSRADMNDSNSPLSWELLDDPFQSSLCSCCESTCKSRSKRGVGPEKESQGLIQNSVFGPLIIVDYSDTRTRNISKSFTEEQETAQLQPAFGSAMGPS